MGPGNAPAPPRRPRVAAAVLLVLVAAALAAALLCGQRRSVVAALIQQAARSRGIEALSLRVAHVGRGAVTLRDVRVGDPPDLRIGRLVVRFEPGRLAAGELLAVELDDVALEARLDDAGLSLGSLDPLLGGGEESGSGSPLPPIQRLSLRGGRVDLETPAGAVVALLEARAARGSPGLVGTAKLVVLAESLELDAPALRGERARLSAEAMILADDDGLRVELEDCATVSIEALALPSRGSLGAPLSVCLRRPEGAFLTLGWDDVASLELHLDIEPAELSLRAGGEAEPLEVAGTTPSLELGLSGADAGDWRLALQASGGSLALPRQQLELASLSARLELAGAALASPAELRVGRIVDGTGERFAPLDLRLTLAPDAAAYALSASLHAAGEERLAYRGEAALAPPATRGELTLRPVRFAPAGLRLGSLSPALARQARDLAGTVSGHGRLEYAAQESEPLSLDFELALQDLSLQSAGGTRVEGLSGTVQLLAPPLRTPADQRLRFAALDGGLPFSDGEVRFRLGAGSVLEIQDARWRYAGGTLRTAGTVDYAAPVQALTVEAEGLDIATLIEEIEVSALSGDGRLAGRLPLEQEGSRVFVRGAELHAQGPGVLRYAGAAEVPGTAGQLAALEDFRYERLELRMDGDLEGAAVIGARLEGSNPAYREGHPVILNVNIDADLGALLRGARSATLVPEMLEERLRGRVDEGRE